MNVETSGADTAPEFRASDPEPAPAPGRVPGWSVWALRVLALIVAALVLLQAALAGLFVTGDVGLLTWHSTNASFLELLALLQLVAAILVWRPGRGPAWPVWGSLVLFFLIYAQAASGYARGLSLHIPGGALLFGVTVAMLIALWSPKLRVRRSSPPKRKDSQ